jgi:hypothetical protein
VPGAAPQGGDAVRAEQSCRLGCFGFDVVHRGGLYQMFAESLGGFCRDLGCGCKRGRPGPGSAAPACGRCARGLARQEGLLF